MSRVRPESEKHKDPRKQDPEEGFECVEGCNKILERIQFYEKSVLIKHLQ